MDTSFDANKTKFEDFYSSVLKKQLKKEKRLIKNKYANATGLNLVTNSNDTFDYGQFALNASMQGLSTQRISEMPYANALSSEVQSSLGNGDEVL